MADTARARRMWLAWGLFLVLQLLLGFWTLLVTDMVRELYYPVQWFLTDAYRFVGMPGRVIALAHEQPAVFFGIASVFQAPQLAFFFGQRNDAVRRWVTVLALAVGQFGLYIFLLISAMYFVLLNTRG